MNTVRSDLEKQRSKDLSDIQQAYSKDAARQMQTLYDQLQVPHERASVCFYMYYMHVYVIILEIEVDCVVTGSVVCFVFRFRTVSVEGLFPLLLL